MAAIKKGGASNGNKVTFGKKRRGKAKKSKGPKDCNHKKKYRGQGR